MHYFQFSKLALTLLIVSAFFCTARAQSVALEGIYVVQKTTVTSGGFYNVIPTAYLLFNDGSIYKNFLVSPDYLKISSSKLSEPDQWGIWQKIENKISIRWNNGKTKEWDKWYVGKPAKNGELINGSFYTVSGGGNVAYGGTITYGSIKTITFNEQGQFTLLDITKGVNASQDLYHHQSKSGMYSLNNYSIELMYNNGKKEQRAFYFYHGKDNFGIGGIKNVFSPRKKGK